MVFSQAEICDLILLDLQKHIDPRRIQYNKDEDARTPNVNNHTYLGVNTPPNREIANKYLKILKDQGVKDIDEILKYCDHLLEKKMYELRLIAFQWSFKVKRQYRTEHFKVFQRWILNYLSGWASCDDLCTHSATYHLMMYPEFVGEYKKLVYSENPWARRAAAVILIVPVRKKLFFNHIFDISDALLHDKEDLVLKGCGWLLKEATRHFQQKVYEYVLKHKHDMPRVALRYAIEKLPKEMRTEAMKKK